MRTTSTSLPSLPPVQSPGADASAPVCVAVSTCRERDRAAVFAGLGAAPARRVRTVPRPVAAGAIPSSSARLLQIHAQTSDLAAAIAQVYGALAQSPGQDPQWEMHCRVVLECMRACAGEAYTADLAAVADIGGLHLDAPMSTPRLKLWEGATDDAIVVVLGFSGTRLDANDLLCNMKSQIAQPHVNMLDVRLPTLGNVGAGWQEWWQSEAQLPRTDGAVMKDVLTRYADRARDSGKALSISLTGHSLGAAACTVAGFDIAHFLRADGVSGDVSVYAFNPPRLGQAGIERLYVDTLQSEHSALRFTLRQFARALDPIQSTPLFMHHPHWDHDSDADADAERAGSASGDRFAQFVTSIDQPASRINLADNHELTLWRPYFLSTIQQAELQRIFAPMQA
ncbi:hypothetical protein XBLMG947_1659 [Xanthomonas bromi]|uniref:Fungal lipase-type domain-containing protein n=1 Tax=Xanthomonas bromi TaxID=56449 RepID=A0A1C3NKH6_9XANT|nr:hypothetical protein XBLMG947_1659 [Xanthomonas bromi]